MRGIIALILTTAPTSTAHQVACAVGTSVDAVTLSRAAFDGLQTELKFMQTKIEALMFELARLKHWRFGSSSESLSSSTQAVLFDAIIADIIADTRAEDAAAQDERRALAAAAVEPPKAAPRRAVRSELPASLERTEIHHELDGQSCACGQPLQRIGQDVSEQLDCVPAKFFVLRHIRGHTGAGPPYP